MIHEIIKYGLLGIGGTIVSSYIIEAQMKNYDTVIEPPVDSVSIIMPSYNEELFVEEACKSIKNQSIIKQYPEFFEFIVVDNGSIDKTVELAAQHVDKVVFSKHGKLNARNYASDIAKGNIIVAVDSDILYPEMWLNTLLKPFKNKEVVAVTGSIMDYSIPNTYGLINSLLGVSAKYILYPDQLYGGNSAYRKEIFYKVGKFNENINQNDIKEIFYEEEIYFGNKLKEYGKVEYLLNASCLHVGGFKTGCRYKLSNEEACEILGIGKSRF